MVLRQERLNGFGTLAVEYNLAKSLNYEDIVYDFVAAKFRNANFT